MRTPTFPPRTLRNLIYYSFIPVVVFELALAPFSFAHLYRDHQWLLNVRDLITFGLLPVYLATLGSMFVWRASRGATVAGLAMLIASVALTVFLSYTVWGVSTRRFWAPDYETVLILRVYGEFALAVALLPPFVTLAFRSVSQYASRNA